jgi:copper transport protein
VLGWGAAAAGLGLAVGVGLLVRQVATLAADPGSGAEGAVAREVLSGTRWGVLWLVREAVLLALGAILLATYRTERADSQPEPRSLHTVALPAAGLLVAGLALVNTLAGHAAAGPNARLTLAASTTHLLAAGLWVGGLLALLVGWPRSAEGKVVPAALTRACLRRFGRLALLGVGLVAVTGLYYAGQEVASPDAALTTLYGRALLTKTGLFLATGAFGLANAVLLRPRAAARWSRLLGRPPGRTPPSRRRLRRLVLAEVCLGLLVVGAAGLLGSAAPARGPEFAPAPGPSPAYLTKSAGDLLVTMSVRPNRPGPNLFEVLVASTRRPPLAKIKRVTLRFTGSEDGQVVTSPPLALVRAGRYRLSGDFLRVAGSWRIDALIERSGLQGTTVPFGWSVGSPAPARPVVVSNARLEPLLTRIAAAGFLALLAAGAWLLLRRRLEAAAGGTDRRLASVNRHQLREEAP